MPELSITVPVYRYNRFAPWMLVLYCLATLGLFFMSVHLSSTGVVIYCIILFGLPVYTGLYPRSFLSIRSIDKQPLTISTSCILHGDLSFDINRVENLEIYIYSFDNFRHLYDPDNFGDEKSNINVTTTFIEMGDKNTLGFRCDGKSYDYTFFLSDFRQYDMLYQIVADWQKNLIAVSARSAFEDSYIREQIIRFN